MLDSFPVSCIEVAMISALRNSSNKFVKKILEHPSSLNINWQQSSITLTTTSCTHYTYSSSKETKETKETKEDKETKHVTVPWIEHLLCSRKIWIKKGRHAKDILVSLLQHRCINSTQLSTLVRPIRQPISATSQYNDLIDLLQDVTRTHAIEQNLYNIRRRRLSSYGYYVTERLRSVLAPAMAAEACNIFIMAKIPRIGKDSAIYKYLYKSKMFDRNVCIIFFFINY